MRFRSHVVVTAGVAVILGLLLAASPAVAECDPDNALFEDDFEFLDPSWGAPADNFYVEDGVLVLKSFWGQTNSLTQSEAANVCVDMKIVDAPAPDNSPIGLVWWWENWDNYYYLFYWSDVPYLEIRRVVNGQNQTILSQETLALKQGVGQTNHIEVQLRPKDATLFINGTQITRFKGKPPKGGGSIGVYGSSPEDKPATWAFDNFIVSTPAE
jgi:hypothetical protein